MRIPKHGYSCHKSLKPEMLRGRCMIDERRQAGDWVSFRSKVERFAPQHHHARVFEGVAKSQFSSQGSRFQKWKACPDTLLNGFTPFNTLAWQHFIWRNVGQPECGRAGMADKLGSMCMTGTRSGSRTRWGVVRLLAEASREHPLLAPLPPKYQYVDIPVMSHSDLKCCGAGV